MAQLPVVACFFAVRCTCSLRVTLPGCVADCNLIKRALLCNRLSFRCLQREVQYAALQVFEQLFSSSKGSPSVPPEASSIPAEPWFVTQADILTCFDSVVECLCSDDKRVRFSSVCMCMYMPRTVKRHLCIATTVVTSLILLQEQCAHTAPIQHATSQASIVQQPESKRDCFASPDSVSGRQPELCMGAKTMSWRCRNGLSCPQLGH